MSRPLLKDGLQIIECLTALLLQSKENKLMVVVLLGWSIQSSWVNACPEILYDHPEDFRIPVDKNPIVFVLECKVSLKHGVKI